MSIENPELYMRGIWDWAILDGCFGQSKIKPTDIDGCIERKGKALFIETKQPGAGIPAGQRYMFQNLAQSGVASIIVVWGDTNQPEAIMVFHRNRIEEPHPTDLDGFRERVKNWYRWADDSN